MIGAICLPDSGIYKLPQHLSFTLDTVAAFVWQKCNIFNCFIIYGKQLFNKKRLRKSSLFFVH